MSQAVVVKAATAKMPCGHYRYKLRVTWPDESGFELFCEQCFDSSQEASDAAWAQVGSMKVDDFESLKANAPASDELH